MNSVTTITDRESVPVTIGSLTIWCESFKAAGVRSFSEEPLVSGGGTITNTCPKAMKLTFAGRIFVSDGSLDFVKTASDMLRSGQSFTIAYRGLNFSGCRVQSFNTEDKGEDFIYGVISLITSETVEEDDS